MNRQTPEPEQPINVLTIGMDAKKHAILRMAFKMYTVQRYRLMEDAQGARPDIAIIDMDSVGAQSLWSSFRTKFPELPAVITTATPMADAPAPVVVKPIRMDALFPVLRKTLTAPRAPARPTPAMTQNPATIPTGNAETSSRAKPPGGSPTPARSPSSVAAAPAAKSVPAAKPEAPVVAPRAEAVPLAAPPAQRPQHAFPETAECFNPRHGLFNVLRDIRNRRIPSMVRIDGNDFAMILPVQDNAILLHDPDLLRRACESVTSVITARPLTPQDIPPRAARQGLTSLLWQVSLWTSRGRLMEGLSPEMPLHLRHWPNLTRLAPVPEAMRIAAFWVRFPVNLRLTVKMLNIAPRHVFDFLAATYAIGILDIPEPGTAAVVEPPVSPPAPTAEQKARGGLLSRLLRKIVGM